MVGRHAKLYNGRMSDCDSVFVNGTFVGTTAYFGPPRKYDVPAGVLVEGVNNVTLKLTALNGNGEIVRDKVYKLKGDDDEVELSGVWKYKVGFDRAEAEPYEQRLANLRHAGSGLYNGMIYPCVTGSEGSDMVPRREQCGTGRRVCPVADFPDSGLARDMGVAGDAFPLGAVA